jgi:hypothetical protein
MSTQEQTISINKYSFDAHSSATSGRFGTVAPLTKRRANDGPYRPEGSTRLHLKLSFR